MNGWTGREEAGKEREGAGRRKVKHTSGRRKCWQQEASYKNKNKQNGLLRFSTHRVQGEVGQRYVCRVPHVHKRCRPVLKYQLGAVAQQGKPLHSRDSYRGMLFLVLLFFWGMQQNVYQQGTKWNPCDRTSTLSIVQRR